MPERTIWLSYDMGVRGDYEGLYAWLDKHTARECGDSLAVLRYHYSADFIEELKSDLDRSIDITNLPSRIACPLF
jgi:hypothetical protein